VADWFPIAVAPKDGTLVDLWFGQLGKRYINCWWGTLGGKPGWVWRNDRGDLTGYTNLEPTHFMLPPGAPR